MSNDGPGDLGILQLRNRDLTGESTVGLVEDVLGGNGNLLLLVGDLLGEGQVESRRGDDDLGGLVELGLVEVLDDGGNAFRSTVPVLQKRQRVSVSFLVVVGVTSKGHCGAAVVVVRVMSYILKLPPTKNWRGILNVCLCESKIRRV